MIFYTPHAARRAPLATVAASKSVTYRLCFTSIRRTKMRRTMIARPASGGGMEYWSTEGEWGPKELAFDFGNNEKFAKDTVSSKSVAGIGVLIVTEGTDE